MTREQINRYQMESVMRAFLKPIAKHSKQKTKPKQPAGEAV
jgi:hypothetical protein